MSRFQTLMRREWLQHRLGWSTTILVPPLLLLGVLSVAHIGLPPAVSPLAIVILAATLGTLGGFAIFALATGLQLPGLARRDQQDRSIEFWLSLPLGHAASVAAPLAMHLVVMPLVALAAGWAFGQASGLVVVGRWAGLETLLALPWAPLLRNELAALGAFAFGALVATFWVLPLLLATMAASAWLKRWGLAALVLALSLGHAVLLQLYGIGVVGDGVRALVDEATRAVLLDRDLRLGPHTAAAASTWLHAAPTWLLEDVRAVAGRLLQPLALAALAVSAACFALLVLRRRRGG